jgi:raffinose/stachyose/melibiose transport system substrate-binding protein
MPVTASGASGYVSRARDVGSSWKTERRLMTMNTSKAVVTAVAAIAVAGLMAGCSSNGSSPGVGGSGSGGGSAPVTITLFSTKTENLATLQELVADFHQQNPTITVNVVAPASGGDVLKADLTKNQLPDVVAGGGDSNFLMLQQAGVLDDLSSQPYMADVQQAYVRQVTSMYGTDAVYGVPYATNASGIIYNKDLFTQAGLTPPTTWTELTQDVSALQAAGIVPLELGIQGSDDWTTMCVWNSVAPSLQPADFGENRLKDQATFDPTMAPVVQKYLDVLKLAQPGFNGKALNDALADFASGKTAMLINGSWEIPGIKQLNADVNFGIIPFPTTDTASQNYLSSGVDVLFEVINRSPNQPAAQALVSFLLQPAQALKYSQEQAAFSAVDGVQQTDPTMVDVANDIARGHVADYPDHLYPAGFNMANILSQTSIDFASGMSDADNITKTLQAADAAYDTANTTS